MALRKQGKYWYGDSQEDIRPELLRYSEVNAYVVHHFADAVCKCGGRSFFVTVDDTQGASIRKCTACELEHPIGDSGDYLRDAQLEGCECVCGQAVFEVTAGVSLYDDSEDVRWFYLGCRCIGCGLLGCYGDWKNEFNGYQDLLKHV